MNATSSRDGASARNVLVIGASRGLGLEFVRQYLAAGAKATGTARDDAGRARLEATGARALTLDVADTASAAGLAWQLDGEAFDVVVINAGVYGPRSSALETPSAADFDAVMHTNVLGPMRVLPAVAEALAPDARLAVISSRMGSIGLRANTAGWLYRASKAALNSVLKDASLSLAGRATCIAFHPGWVRTDMGGADADLEPADAVASMRRTIAGLKPSQNGSFLNHDGVPLDW
jgi:NAD(P)-dependent dehydrogenase (short-subunit alcohol dehydrogenase family)